MRDETPGGPQPEVIVDFTFDRGLLHVALVNVSPVSALRVHVEFDKPFCGLGGTVEVSALPLWRLVEFLAPHKRIETFVDSSAAYFQRREPTRLTAAITFHDAWGRAYQREVTHDLGIYRDIAWVAAPATATAAPEHEGHHGDPPRTTLHQLQLPRRHR